MEVFLFKTVTAVVYEQICRSYKILIPYRRQNIINELFYQL